MNLLPYDEFDVLVHLPPREVCRILLENVSKKSFLWSGFLPGNNKFEGDVQETTFKFHRTVVYRNLGLPILCGELEEIDGGTKIKVKMRLHKVVLLFFAFLVLMSLSFVIIGMESYVQGIIMIGAGVAIIFIYLGFLFEAGESKAMFLELFEKEIGTANKAAGSDR